ncbi:MAG: biotin/lipoyl-containing protein, partial [Myxococcota bacterium]
MAEFFLMPQASPTMEAGKVLEWHKSEGDALAPQDVIAEVETDKAAMEVEVFDPGYLLKIIVPAGTEAKVDQPIAIIGQSADEDYADLLTQLGDAAPAAPPAEAPAPAPEPAPAPAAVEEEVVTDAAYFLMPQASPTMEAGKILAWHKSEGDALAPQDVIAEVETDKAAMEVEVFDPGYLLKILVP